MPEEHPKIDWSKVILTALASVVLLSTTTYIGYWCGVRQSIQPTQQTSTTELTPTPTQPVGNQWKNKIAFTKIENRFAKSVWLMDPDGSNQQRLITYDIDYVEDINWSPDKTKVAYLLEKYVYRTPDTSELRYIDLNTNESVLVRSFQRPASGYIRYQFSWLKDSSGIIYSKENEIWKYDIASQKNALLTDQIVYTAPLDVWYRHMPISVTNKSIFFDADGYLGKIAIDNPSDVTEVISGTIESFSVAPDESSLVYTKNPTDRYLTQVVVHRNLQTQEEKELQEDYGCAGWHPGVYAPDSSRFLLHYQCGDSIEIKIYNKNGSLINDIQSQKEGMPLHHALWAPDGTQLFVVFAQGLATIDFASIFDTNGQNEQTLDIQNIEEMSRFSWSSY